MNSSNKTCPVCTLFLREGVTLQSHLDTHPKEQVIEALLKLSSEKSPAQETQPTPTSSSPYVPVQSFPNSNQSFISQPPQSILNINPQTQMTTAVTYQHFMTSNGSAILPQYIQVPAVVNPSNNVPVISAQAVNYVPNPSVNYPHTAYNPLYNPYIPQPYPFTPPYFTGFPVSAAPQADSNTQASQNSNPTPPVENQQESPSIESSVSVKKRTVATCTELDKRNPKSKKLVWKHSSTRRRVKLAKQKESSSSRSSGKGCIQGKIPPAKPSVIRLLRPKIPATSTASTNIISPPPLTPITETPTRSLSGTKTPPPPPLSKAPYFVPQVKGEDVPDCARPQSTIINGCSSGGETDYLEQPQKPSSVIVESSNVLQTSNKSLDSKENEDEGDVENAMTLSERKEMETNESTDPLGEEASEEGQAEGDGEENPEKVFELFEVVEESKVEVGTTVVNQDIPREISSENIERNCDGSDIFIQQENIHFNEDPERERPNDPGETVEPSYKNQTNDYEFSEKDQQEAEEESAEDNNNQPEPPQQQQPATYTDLQPAKPTRVYQDMTITPPLNLGNFMEVDGIKIFFNSSATNGNFEPVVKVANIQANGTNISALMKSENHVVVDSVIQLVSGKAETQSEVPFGGDNYTPTTSQVNDIQLDFPDLSPLGLNIQADESMPARGELSEQESLGAENSTWNLFHGNGVSAEEWKPDVSQQPVPVIGSKKKEAKFKCWSCEEVFSCSKERRVHNNTVHMNKGEQEKTGSPSSKKPKSFACSFCSEVFTCLRDRKAHVAETHKNKEMKEDRAEPECSSSETVKNEGEPESNGNVKTENGGPGSLPEGDPRRPKYCSRCSLPFMGVKKLWEHLREVHGEIRYKCEKCSACFDEENQYNDHLLVHPLVCSKCGKTFHKRPNLNLHMKRHLEVKPYECNLCPKSFITRQKLEEHMNGHSGKKPLKCTLCDKTFSRYSNLIQHKNLHHLNIKKKIKDFVCRCGEVFHSLRKLEWHKEVHEPKPKPCPFCSQKFIHSASVTRHIRRAHLPDYLPGDNREFENVQCPICEKIYLRSSLVVHMRVHNGEKPFACKVCNKKFSTKWNLELHSWTHQSRSNMPFKCQVCKSAFFRETDFVAHLNAHRNYKPFTCNICGQKFIRKYSCLRHQEEHKKSKQYVCAVNGCAKTFHRGYYLKDHMKVHTGVRPHTCHICGKASSTKSNHNKHVRIHDTREPVNTEN